MSTPDIAAFQYQILWANFVISLIVGIGAISLTVAYIVKMYREKQTRRERIIFLLSIPAAFGLIWLFVHLMPAPW